MNHLEVFIELWDNAGTAFPELIRIYSQNEQKQKEKHLHQLIGQLKSHNGQEIKNPHALIDKEFFKSLKGFFKNVMDYSEDQLSMIFSDQMLSSTFGFISAAVKFDPDLSMQSIFQACRNVWIMNGVQLLLGEKVRLSPSVFAYSMLYPYTDNFIDDPCVTNYQKAEFSLRFAKRLNGDKIAPENPVEVKIFNLVGMIEKEWDRDLYPGVYRSLLAIHSAQTKSMELISRTGDERLSSRQALIICADKGGTSVVADGYLVKGDLDSSLEGFLFIYGAYLQLLDDLQDLDEDAGNGLMTCFYIASLEGGIDSSINKLYRLGEDVVLMMKRAGIDNEQFAGLIKKSFHLFIIGSVITGQRFFCRKYISAFHKHYPLDPEYIIRQKQNSEKYQELLFNKISEFALSANSIPEWVSNEA
jgi:hypothetical protein